MSTKAEKLAFIPTVVEAVRTGKEEDIEAAFHPDFKMLVPGTGGRESKEMPAPPGIAGKYPYRSRKPNLSRSKGHHRCVA